MLGKLGKPDSCTCTHTFATLVRKMIIEILHESKGSSRDWTGDPWICCRTRSLPTALRAPVRNRLDADPDLMIFVVSWSFFFLEKNRFACCFFVCFFFGGGGVFCLFWVFFFFWFFLLFFRNAIIVSNSFNPYQYQYDMV